MDKYTNKETVIIKMKYSINYFFDGIKYKTKRSIENVAKYIIRKLNKESNIVKRAESEIKLAFKDSDNDFMQKRMNTEIVDILSVLSSQNDSGFSIGYKIKMLNKLIENKPLSKLTFEDDEFGCNDMDGNTMQNIRCSSIFKRKDTGEVSYLESFKKRTRYGIKEDGKIDPSDSGVGSMWYGGMVVIPKKEKPYYLGKDFILDKDNFNFQEFIIDTYDIEYPEGWWISACKESDLKEYSKIYGFKKDYDTYESELDYKGGMYKEKLLELIDVVKKHMYKAK